MEAAIQARAAERENTLEPLVERRIADLRAALKAEPFDLETANAALRHCVRHVEVDYLRGELFVSWLHGGVTDLTFAWPDEASDDGEEPSAASA